MDCTFYGPGGFRCTHAAADAAAAAAHVRQHQQMLERLAGGGAACSRCFLFAGPDEAAVAEHARRAHAADPNGKPAAFFLPAEGRGSGR